MIGEDQNYFGGRVGIGTTAPDQPLTVSGQASKTGGGSWLTFSDKRVKKDVADFTDGLSVLKKFSPVKFKYNGLAGYNDDGQEYVGVIAQEVQPVAPYMISTVNKKLKETDASTTDILMYDGSALTYVLVNAVKEQQKMIDDQQKMIDSLKSSEVESKRKIAALETSLQNTQSSTSELEKLKSEIENIKKALGLSVKAAVPAKKEDKKNEQ